MTQKVNLIIQESSLLKIVIRNWALCFLLFFIVLFSFTGSGFLSIVNFQNIIHLSIIAILMAFAETLVITTGGIDLSVCFVLGLSSVT
ncbi:MAG: hypothetical protein PF518_08640, partial [Spirochaetaceae bacterium]|nr:hypothetical protein [Spirochaetaceae bacterium]